MNAIQLDKVSNQLLGIAAALICLLNLYELEYSDVLGIADNMVFSGVNNNLLPDFKKIEKYIKSEWEL